MLMVMAVSLWDKIVDFKPEKTVFLVFFKSYYYLLWSFKSRDMDRGLRTSKIGCVLAGFMMIL